jgi:hypothetical protein
MNRTTQLITFLILMLSFGISSSFAQQDDFEFRVKNVKDPSAERYLVEKLNVKVFLEDFEPGNSYWGIVENDKPGRLTFRFPLPGPMNRCKLGVNLWSANFRNTKILGKGVGSVSLWASRDGQEWILLKELLPPSKSSFDGVFFINYLPKELQGTEEIWLQTRFTATEMTDPSYSVAQFCRDNLADPNNYVFSLRANCQKPKNKMDIAKSANSK